MDIKGIKILAAMNSFYQVLSSEAFSKHGINPHAVLFDETHVANREMFNVMTHGAADTRRQPVNFLITTAGNVVHYGFIETFIEELGTKYNIREIAFDRWGAVQMSQNLDGMGFTVVPFGQGYKDMSPPTKELMKLTLEKKISHGGNPVLRWMMDNIHIKMDPAGNIKPDKEKNTEKIDGAVDTIMALDRAIRNEGNEGGSVYDERGIIIL